MSNLIYLCILSSVIPRLPCPFKMAKAVSSTVLLVNSETSISVNSFTFAMWAFASKCFPIELVPCSDGWRRTWWQTIHMMPGLPVASIPECRLDRHDSACLELFHAIGRFEPSFNESHHLSQMICNVRSLKSPIETCLCLEEIINSSKEVFKDLEAGMAVRIRMLVDLTQNTGVTNDTVKQTASS